MFIDHDLLDDVLGAGAIAATVGSSIVGVLLIRFFSRRDRDRETLVYHGARLTGMETWHRQEGYVPPSRDDAV